MRVSIITVSYNSAETIERTIDSVRFQTWSDIQHIVIDGGSTDGTPQIIERYRDSIKNYLSEPDNGIYDAMNKGMDLADGDIICFLNADDFYASPEIISNVVASMKQANCEALIGDVAFFKKNNPRSRYKTLQIESIHSRKIVLGVDACTSGALSSKRCGTKSGAI